MKYAVIKGGVIETFIEATPEFVANPPRQYADAIFLLAETDVSDTSTGNDKITLVSDFVYVPEENRVFRTRVTRDKTRQEMNHESDAQKTVDAIFLTEKGLGKILFEIVNRVLVLQGQDKLTPSQFKTWVRNQL